MNKIYQINVTVKDDDVSYAEIEEVLKKLNVEVNLIEEFDY